MEDFSTDIRHSTEKVREISDQKGPTQHFWSEGMFHKAKHNFRTT